LEPVELKEVRNVSAVGFPRVPKSWCSKWLPTLPLSSEVGTPSAGTSLSASPTASAAPASAVPSAQAAPPLTDVPWAPLVADGVLPSLHLAEGASGSTPAPLRSALPAPPPKQEAIPPPAPVPPTLAPLAKKQVFRKGRLKGPAALRNAEMERALRLQWSALSESERAMLIEGAHSPAHISQQWQAYQAQVYQYWSVTGMPPPLPYAPIQFALVPASSTMPFAPAPAPSGPSAASMDDRWANLWKAKKAKVAVGPPSQIAAPAPAAPVAGPNNDTLLSQVLDGMTEEDAFEELFGAALTPIESF